MNRKNTTMDVRKPDQFLLILNRAFEWMVSRVALIGGVFVLFVIFGGGWAIWSHLSQSTELTWMAKYAPIEKALGEKKRGFQEALQREQARKNDPKTQKEAVSGLPTGSFSEDYGALAGDLQKIIQEAPKSRAAELAALNLAALQAEHQQLKEALSTLEKVNVSNRTKDLVGALTVNMKASLMASLDRCDDALTIFEKVLKDNQAAFMHQEVKLRMGLCYEKKNDLDRAQALYSEVSTSSPEKDTPNQGSWTEDADRYLRLLKLKQLEQRGS